MLVEYLSQGLLVTDSIIIIHCREKSEIGQFQVVYKYYRKPVIVQDNLKIKTKFYCELSSK